MDDNSSDNKGGLLKASLAFTPLGTGIGVTGYQVMKDRSHIPARESNLTRGLDSLREASSGPRIPNITEVSRFMNHGVVGSPVHSDVAKQAWDWAMLGVDPGTKDSLLTFTRNIHNLQGRDVTQAIEQTLRQNTSTTMGNIWNRFRRNVELLEVQRNLFNGLPAFGPINSSGVMQNMQGPSQHIRDRLNRIGQKLGAKTNIYSMTRPELINEGYGIHNIVFKGGKYGDISLHLPETRNGVLFEGSTLQTKRIAPDVLIKGQQGLERMSRSEYFLKELEESILPDIGGRLKTGRDIERAIKQARWSIFGELEAVPNIPTNLNIPSQLQYEKLRGGAVDIRIPVTQRKIWEGADPFVSSFRTPNESELTGILTSKEGQMMGLRGGAGPKSMSQGRLSTVPWESFDISGGPVEYGRRPEQPFRRFQLTSESMDFMNRHSRLKKYRAYEALGQKLSNNLAMGPTMKVLYVNPESSTLAAGGRGEMLERLGMGDGEALLRKGIAEKLSFESVETVKLKHARQDILAKGLDAIQPGEILGVTERGQPFVYQEGMKILSSRAFHSDSYGDFLSVGYTQKHKLEHGAKFFGSAKAVTLQRSDPEFSRAVQSLTGSDIAADMIVNMDELKKNKALHRRQMLTALSDIVSETMATQPSKRAAKMLWNRDVSALGAAFSKGATRGGVYQHNLFTERLMKFAARDLNLTPQQFGQVFGSVPVALGEEEATSILSRTLLKGQGLPLEQYAEFRQAMMSGVASGAGTFSFGGPAIEVGGLGSLEPRAFDILSGKSFGAMGQSLSEEFLHRMQAASPETLIAHREMGKTLQSLVGQFKGKSGAVFDLAQGYHPDRFQNFIEKGGGILRPGKGMRDIYIPGGDVMHGLMRFETGAGDAVKSQLSRVYHDIARTAGDFAVGDLDAAQYNRNLELVADNLRKEWAPFGKGAGSVARGKILGSAFLRGMTTTPVGAHSAIREANVIGLGEQRFKEMAEQLTRAGYDEARIAQMTNEFVQGNKVAGLVARHPFIGEHSLQPVLFQKAIGAGPDDIIIPELGVNIRARTQTGALKEKRITLGPLVGMAGDKDADAYSALLVSPDKEKELRKMITQSDNEFAQRYTQHQVRMQLFKPKAASDEGLTTIAKMAGDVEKLAAGQKWVGPLSVQLSSAKSALSMHGQGKAAADARFLLEWLEQTPISAKHLSASEAAGGGLTSLMETITSSLENQNEVRLTSAIENIVANDAVSSDMLTGNIHLDVGAKNIQNIMGVKMGQKLQGIDVQGATKELMRTMSEHHITGEARAYERLAGRGSRIKMTEIPEMLAKGVGSEGMRQLSGAFGKISSAITAGANIMGQVGRSIVKHHKAIGLGFAGSLALSAVLSNPKETIGPGAGLVPQGKVNMNSGKATTRMKPEDMQAPQQPSGQPTAPNMLAAQQARVQMNPGRRVSVRGRVPMSVNAGIIAGQMGSLGANTSVNLRDNRTTLLPHEIANKVL